MTSSRAWPLRAHLGDGILDLVNEAAPITLPKKSSDKLLGLEVLKLVHVFTCRSKGINCKSRKTLRQAVLKHDYGLPHQQPWNL